MSIANGVIGDDKINCHNAHEVGIASMSKLMGQTFNNIKLKHADKVLPLLCMNSTMKIHDDKVPIDPVLLFQHMSITKTFEYELEKFFEYKLALSIYRSLMQLECIKTQKSAIYECFECVNIDIESANATYSTSSMEDTCYIVLSCVGSREHI